ncbi:MAG: putative single-strand DNA-specific exonuclease [Prokaryotic dsDNA virus sp.]|nr:MAG: putative single-strand DNA-specific exonuclease [Prokaryotic dsDNA virus sp.]|tara:strand:- start:22409 stop:23302 length:894 start_codon:yes stop_codon:yes gene_type:complete
MPYKPDVLIYHDNCDDGFAAAWAIHKKWGDTVQFLPSNYGRPMPTWKDGREVLVADFSFPPEQCEELANQGCRVLMLDHHKTAKEALSGLPQVQKPTYKNVGQMFDRLTGTWRDEVLVEFDMDRSGARMAWDFAFPGEETPELILAVEDRDLWRFNRPDTKLVSMYLRSLDRSFAQWDAAAALYGENPDQFLSEATAIKRFYDQRVKAICDSARLQTFHGHSGVAVTYACPYDFVSDTCNTLLAMHPDAPFAVAVIQNQEGITYSLRSTDDRVDVSEIAKANGGGGHRNAAGFRVAA